MPNSTFDIVSTWLHCKMKKKQQRHVSSFDRFEQCEKCTRQRVAVVIIPCESRRAIDKNSKLEISLESVMKYLLLKFSIYVGANFRKDLMPKWEQWLFHRNCPNELIECSRKKYDRITRDSAINRSDIIRRSFLRRRRFTSTQLSFLWTFLNFNARMMMKIEILPRFYHFAMKMRRQKRRENFRFRWDSAEKSAKCCLQESNARRGEKLIFVGCIIGRQFKWLLFSRWMLQVVCWMKFTSREFVLVGLLRFLD